MNEFVKVNNIKTGEYYFAYKQEIDLGLRNVKCFKQTFYGPGCHRYRNGDVTGFVCNGPAYRFKEPDHKVFRRYFLEVVGPAEIEDPDKEIIDDLIDKLKDTGND